MVFVLATIPQTTEKSDWILMNDLESGSLYLKIANNGLSIHWNESDICLNHCLIFISGSSQLLHFRN